MNPAPSIVFFTTASGAGYGLLFWLGLLRPLRMAPHAPEFGLLALAVALVLIVAGLASSLLHLGRPERAWRALSQWRSSWLSREGVAAIATFVPAGLFGLGLLTGWDGLAVPAGLLAALGAAATVWCTGMIYASLKPIRQWHHPLVAPGYMVFAGFSGAALLAALGALAGRATVPALLAIGLGLAALVLKRRYWAAIDAKPPRGTPTIESATGLGRIGRTRPLDPPHTEQNWLLREMGFRIARKHRDRLRGLALGGFGGAALLALLALPLGGPLAALLLAAGALLALGGLLVERWLMFAEATHTVTLFYTGEA
ncbi:dimethyl sulfoxide reductase anchor subunit family protein [Falsiroseomonas selenitidurans]|uniref:Dimethyl sulfoxide reductase anchor subunit n=1 Tax=Falsiroseomonas selenitidurans TaxID=2716335 RepID=A0ABX1DY10_9PROT|nr:DmsC/YnfH family molybdoenzyme membrane anchor subunit [Falsiroseomonas selenitidurans]NKC29804.1 dimethyl sulfoxide reductase anchor subunit [Falsiroseomonas selenitidurans]